MTKPNDFILNSDYLSLAQTYSTELTAVFPAETFQPGSTEVRTVDFTVPKSQGAIDMFLISLNGADYELGASLLDHQISPQQGPPYYYLEFLVVRTSPTNIQIQMHEFNQSTGGVSLPTYNVKVKVSSFRPPNVF